MSIGHVSPEAASKGLIALIKNGDIIDIDIPKRSIDVRVAKAELERRSAEEEAAGKKAYKPKTRNRVIPASLRAYAANVSSADSGAVRIIEYLNKDII